MYGDYLLSLKSVVICNSDEISHNTLKILTTTYILKWCRMFLKQTILQMKVDKFKK